MRDAPRLLLVDDEEPLLRSLVRAVQDLGYAAASALSGDEAWQRLQQEAYDLVVTDLRMPGLDGPELLARIDRNRIPTRVLVITGYATLEAAVDCLRKGAMDFLVKPFDMAAFQASVRKTLARPLPHSPLLDPEWAAVASRFELTHRQAEILKTFYCTGKSNRELADAMCLSPHTIKSHLKAAFAKVGVSNRAQLLRKLRDG